jgi:hypothetical protein
MPHQEELQRVASSKIFVSLLHGYTYQANNTFRSATRMTISRPRNEPKDEKKTRKQAVKADRQARRIEKKATKEEYSSEAKHQIKGIINSEKTRLRKL